MNPNEKYGFSGRKNGRFSGVGTRSGADSFTPVDPSVSSGTRRDADSFEPSANGENENGADTKGKLKRNIIIGFIGLIILLLLIGLFLKSK